MTIKSLLDILNLNKFISFDLETTGLDQESDSIIEISAYLFIEGNPIKSYTKLVNPNINIPASISELTNISNSDIRNKPLINEVLPEFIDFIDDIPIVGHNIHFDIGFLNNPLMKGDFPIYNNDRVYDTLKLAKSFLYFNQDNSLSGISDFYSLNHENAHRAEEDALNTGKIFVLLLNEIASHKPRIINTICDIINAKSMKNYYLYNDLKKYYSTSSSKASITKSNFNFKLKYNITKNYNKYIDHELLDIDSIIGNDGLFEKKWDKFSARQGQVKFSKNILSSFKSQNILIAEAGTGLGKSFSYLTASIIHSNKENVPIVISTHTKNLQDQLFSKDIPKFIEITNYPISSIVLKGRNNYICKTRFKYFVENRLFKLSPKEKEIFLSIIIWAEKTKTGDIEECISFSSNRARNIWYSIRSEPGYCTTSKCKEYNGCFYGKLRRSVPNTNLIILNHALFCTELNRENSILPSTFNYVIDEGHNLVKSAREQLTDKLNSEIIDDVLNYFKFKNDLTSKSFISSLQSIIPNLVSLSEEIDGLTKSLKINYHLFFKELTEKMFKKEELEKNKYDKKLIIDNPHNIYKNLDVNVDKLIDYFIEFDKKINLLYNEINKSKTFPEEIKQQLLSKNLIFASILEVFTRIIHVVEEDIVWISVKNKYNSFQCSIHCAPRNVGPYLRDTLFNRENGGVVTSATLALNSSFDFIIDSLGINNSKIFDKLNTVEYHSPFYYEDQAEIWTFNSNENINSLSFLKNISAQICELASIYDKRILVLCTSYEHVNKIEKYISPYLSNLRKKIFAQTYGKNRNNIIKGYKNNYNSILIGTLSFWEGVDFPGNLLEILIIVKIPFDNPSDPIFKTELNNCEKNGKNPFIDYQIPNAAVKLKQGFGRLIRSFNDTGICILTDPRFLKSRYGSLLLDTLPIKTKHYNKIDDIKNNSKIFN